MNPFTIEFKSHPFHRIDLGGNAHDFLSQLNKIVDHKISIFILKIP